LPHMVNMLSIIDRYIIKKFIYTFLFSTGLFSIIGIFIDVSEKIDDFLKRKPSLYTLIFDYYIYFLPWFYGLFGPIFVFLSCLFFNSRLAQNTEIISILNTGTKYRYFLKPYILSVALLVILFIGLNTYIIPISEKHKLEFEEEWIREHKTTNAGNIYAQIQQGTFLYMESFNYLDSTGMNLSMERYENNRAVQRIFASRLVWNKDLQKWKLENYVQRIFHDSTETIIRGAAKDTVLPIKPSEFIIKTKFISAMTNPELNDYIRKEREKGSSQLNTFYVELYRRIASAVSFIPLALLAVAISSQKRRGGMGLSLGIGIFITLAYLMLVQIFNTFGMNQVMHPMVAVWTPVIFFSLLAGYMLYKAPK
jgi:lipopolysaccharide export system permease protein